MFSNASTEEVIRAYRNRTQTPAEKILIDALESLNERYHAALNELATKTEDER